jgi:hypothetical protein
VAFKAAQYLEVILPREEDDILDVSKLFGVFDADDVRVGAERLSPWLAGCWCVSG